MPNIKYTIDSSFLEGYIRCDVDFSENEKKKLRKLKFTKIADSSVYINKNFISVYKNEVINYNIEMYDLKIKSIKETSRYIEYYIKGKYSTSNPKDKDEFFEYLKKNK